MIFFLNIVYLHKCTLQCMSGHMVARVGLLVNLNSILLNLSICRVLMGNGVGILALPMQKICTLGKPNSPFINEWPNIDGPPLQDKTKQYTYT